jgi:hypothetical protein
VAARPALEIEDAVRELAPSAGCRIVAVLGYSKGRVDELHPICEARLRRAGLEAPGAYAIVFSGWARRSGHRSEAELMHEAWRAEEGVVVRDSHARTTAQNVAHVAALARAVRAAEIVVVTSSWHAGRTRAFFRSLLRADDVRVRIVCPDEKRSPLFVARELVRWPLVPIQTRRTGARRWATPER